jgi:hypothetical protein
MMYGFVSNQFYFANIQLFFKIHLCIYKKFNFIYGNYSLFVYLVYKTNILTYYNMDIGRKIAFGIQLA